MTTSRLAQSPWQSLDTLFSAGAVGTLPDPDLLRCFRSEGGARGEEAFRVLVERHGPMVLSLCHSLIPDSHEAEDAFQATFLVLVRKGHTIWVRDSVGPWLYGVATKVARRARRRSITRQRFQVAIADDVADLKTNAPAIDVHSHEIGRAIHEEVARLPASLRDAIVLCTFEGMTYHAAARQLGVPEPTLRGRLRRARHRLESQLRQRGIAALMPAAPLAAPPPALVRSTVQHAAWWTSMTGLIGGSSGIPASIAVLARTVLRSMMLGACKVPAAIALLAGGILAAAVWAQPGEPVRLAARSEPRPKQSANPAAQVAAAPQPQPTARPGARVITGRLTDATGRPVSGAKLMFAPKTPLLPFEEGGTAVSDAEGRYRIELAGFPLGANTLPATDAVRYLVLAPGFRSEFGNIDAGNTPVALDVRLSAEEWPPTEILLVDRDGKPVEGAELTLQLGGSFTWSRETSDAQGRTIVKSPRTQGFMMSIRRDGFLPTRLGTPGTAEGPPKSLSVPLYPTIEGRVVDEAGLPLSGIRVGRLIAPNYDAGLDKPSDYLEVLAPAGSAKPAITDNLGRFQLAPRITLDNRTGKYKVWPMAVCFADAELRRVHFLRVDLEAPRQPYEIVLRPARHVRIPIEHVVMAPSSSLESWWELNDLAGTGKPDLGLFVMQGLVQKLGTGGNSSPGDWIDSYWPAGKYRVQVNSVVTEPREGAEETWAVIVVPPGDGPLVLPPIQMTVLPLRGLVSKPAPEIDAKDLNTGAPVKLADFKGRVVVLDFWGYWCGPCIGAMPALMEAYDKFKDKPVTIIALHDQSVQSRVDYDRRLSEVKRQAWGNRELPFQVALDVPDPSAPAGVAAIGQGITCKRYQITGFPTTLVIDQNGKVVGRVEVREKGKLEAMLNELLNKTSKK